LRAFLLGRQQHNRIVRLASVIQRSQCLANQIIRKTDRRKVPANARTYNTHSAIIYFNQCSSQGSGTFH